MMMRNEVPNANVVDIGFDGLQVGGDVQLPGRPPAFQFWAQLVPLLFHPGDVFPLMMQQERSRLDEALNQQHLLSGGGSFFQHVPHVFPCFVSVPELSLVKQSQPFLEKRRFF